MNGPLRCLNGDVAKKEALLEALSYDIRVYSSSFVSFGPNTFPFIPGKLLDKARLLDTTILSVYYVYWPSLSCIFSAFFSWLHCS